MGSYKGQQNARCKALSFIQDLAQTAWQVPTIIELDPTIFQKNPKSKNRALQISNDSITNSNYFLFNVLVRNLHVDLEEDPRPWTPTKSTSTREISVAHANYFHTNFSFHPH